MADITSEVKEKDSEFPPVDEDEDLEVVSEVIEQPSVLTSPQDSKTTPSPSTTVSSSQNEGIRGWELVFCR